MRFSFKRRREETEGGVRNSCPTTLGLEDTARRTTTLKQIRPGVFTRVDFSGQDLQIGLQFRFIFEIFLVSISFIDFLSFSFTFFRSEIFITDILRYILIVLLQLIFLFFFFFFFFFLCVLILVESSSNLKKNSV